MFENKFHEVDSAVVNSANIICVEYIIKLRQKCYHLNVVGRAVFSKVRSANRFKMVRQKNFNRQNEMFLFDPLCKMAEYNN